MEQRKLDCFFRPKVPRLEERVQDDGNSGENDNEEGNAANKDQGVVPSKKERVFQSEWELFGASFTGFTRIHFLIFLNLLL